MCILHVLFNQTSVEQDCQECLHDIYIYYESEPKAWAEYRYKRSEANLGGVALIWARLGR